MPLSKDEQDKIRTILDLKLKHSRCALCQSTSWSLSDEFVPVIAQSDFKSIRFTGSFYPCIAICCNTCGNTHLLNIHVALPEIAAQYLRKEKMT